jgi:hypothetical protein
MGRRSRVGIPMVVVMLTAGCESPAAPDKTGPVHVSGRVLSYYRASEFNPIGGARLKAWVETDGRGTPARIPLDNQARFTVTVKRGSRVRLYAGGGTGDEIYQPCAVTVVADSDVNRDVRVVNDYSIIGRAIPPVFLEQTRILSGQVYETIPGVGRQPVPMATVAVGGFNDWGYDLGWPIANTRADSDGQYIICGLEAETTVTVYVTTQGREMVVSTVTLSGDTVLDLELGGIRDARTQTIGIR